MSEAVLDLSVLESMFGGDAELCEAILAEFKGSSLPYLAELDQALFSHQVDGVRSLAHKLKSSSRTVGAVLLGDTCEQLERLAPEQNWPQVEALSLELKTRLMDVIEIIDRC